VYISIHDNDRLGSAEKVGGFYLRASLADLAHPVCRWPFHENVGTWRMAARSQLGNIVTA
jgi:hypothetical protein